MKMRRRRAVAALRGALSRSSVYAIVVAVALPLTATSFDETEIVATLVCFGAFLVIELLRSKERW